MSQPIELDVKIGALPSPTDTEELYVKVTRQGSQMTITTKLPRVPPSGKADVRAQTTLNNTSYLAEKSIDLSNNVLRLELGQSDIKAQPVNDTEFVNLRIEVVGDLQSGKELFVHIKTTDTSNVVYTQQVPAKTGSRNLSVSVAPGDYTIQAPDLIDNKIVYSIDVAPNLTVAPDGTSELHLRTMRGAQPKVQTIELAKSVEKQVGGGHTVLPVMKSYKCNLSLGDVHEGPDTASSNDGAIDGALWGA